MNKSNGIYKPEIIPGSLMKIGLDAQTYQLHRGKKHLDQAIDQCHDPRAAMEEFLYRFDEYGRG